MACGCRPANMHRADCPALGGVILGPPKSSGFSDAARIEASEVVEADTDRIVDIVSLVASLDDTAAFFLGKPR